MLGLPQTVPTHDSPTHLPVPRRRSINPFAPMPSQFECVDTRTNLEPTSMLSPCLHTCSLSISQTTPMFVCIMVTRYCMRSVCNKCCRDSGKMTRMCAKCATMIKNIRGKLSCETRPPKVEWTACSRKKKHRAGDDRFVPPSVKVTYTHTIKVNGVSVPLTKEVIGSIHD